MSEFEQHEYPDSAVIQGSVEAEHRIFDDPEMGTFMRRDGEMVWINAYLGLRMIVANYPPAPLPCLVPGAIYPGKIQKTYAASDEDVAKVFGKTVRSHEGSGWKHARAPKPVEDSAR